MVSAKTIQSIGERNFTSYDYVDIAEGISTIEYFAGNLTTSSPSVQTVLSTKEFYSHDYTEGASAASSGVVISKNYAMPFKYPRIVEGYMIVNSSIWANLTAGTTVINATWKLKKNGNTIVTVSRLPLFNFIGAGTQSKRAAILLLVPRTKFGRGDILSMHIEISNTPGVGAAGSIVLFADPYNRTDTEKSSGMITRLSVYIPFVPEL